MLIAALVATALRPIADDIDREWAQWGVFAVAMLVATAVVWVASNGPPTSGIGYARGTGVVEY